MKPKVKNILSAIIFSFSMLNTAYAGPFAHEPIRGDTATTHAKKPEEPKIDPKKQEQAELAVTAIHHCLAMDGDLTEQDRLIDAYNYQPDLDNLPDDLSQMQKEKAMLYTMGRPDIPDFGFVIPNIWRVAKRDERIKFDSIMTIRLNQALKFRNKGFAFAGNCKPTLNGEIQKDKSGDHASVSMPLAFDSKEVKLTYLLSRQPGYNWQIDDLLIDNVGVTNLVKKDLADSVAKNGLAATTNDLCKSAKLDSLKCD